MTCIIGLKTEENVYLAGDSLLTFSNMCFDIEPPKLFDVYQNNRKYIMGFSGVPRICNLFYASQDAVKDKLIEMPRFEFGNNNTTKIENYGIMVKWVNETLIPLLIDYKMAGMNKNDEDYAGVDMSCDFFMGFQKILFRVSRYFNITMIEKFQAIGTGEEFAIGILGYIDDSYDLDLYLKNDVYFSLKLKKILSVVARYNMYVREPFHVIKTIDRDEKKEEE